MQVWTLCRRAQHCIAKTMFVAGWDRGLTLMALQQMLVMPHWELNSVFCAELCQQWVCVPWIDQARERERRGLHDGLRDERTVGVAGAVSALAVRVAAVRSGAVAASVLLGWGRWWWGWGWLRRLGRFVGSSNGGRSEDADEGEKLGKVHSDGRERFVKSDVEGFEIVLIAGR